MKCSQECQEAFAEYAKLVAEWNEKWPNHCDDCQGWGLLYSTYDPSPSGVALSPGYFTDVDVCSECLEKGKCPRCAGDVDQEDENCCHCGSVFGKDGLEYGPECLCWIEEYHDN